MNGLRTLLAALAFATATPAIATDVGGPINTQTVWSQANSPYVVTADIIVNAQLIIEPGVTVYMSPNTGIAVAHTLTAQGTAQAPITITSVRARPGSGSSPQPGDWNQLELRETAALQSRIEHMAISYGSGVVLQRTSPLLSHVAFEHHLGAALRMPLDAQPVGGGLTAIGNRVNGIVVPAGTVHSGSWNLTGIPYVVESGLVRVGQVAVELRAPGDRVQLGGSIDLTLVLAEPAPVGGLEALLSSETVGVFGFPATASIPAGQTEISLPVQGLELGVGAITAMIAGRGSDSVYLRVAELPALQFNSADVSVPVGRSRTLGFSLSEPAPASGLLVQLVATDPALLDLPATISVPAGVNGASFEVTGLVAGTTDLQASAIGYQPATRSIQVRPLSLSWADDIRIPPGTSNVLLTLSDPAPAGGLSLGLSSDAPQVLDVPAAVSVPAGAIQVQVPMTGLVEGSAHVQASATGYGTAQADVVVEIIQLSFDEASYTVAQGLDEPFTVRASRPAPAGGLVVQLSSSAPELASVTPASVTIPAGQTSAPVRADVLGLVQGEALIQAHGEGLVAGTLAITVGTAPQLAFGSAAFDVGVGLRTTASPQLHMQRDGVWITSRRARTFSLQSGSAASYAVPATVSIPAGAVSVAVPITGVAITVQAAPLSAAAEPFQSATLAVSVVQPVLEFDGLIGQRPLIDGRDVFSLRWHVPGTLVQSQVAAQLQLIEISIVDADPVGIVAGIFNSGFGGSPVAQVSMPAGASTTSGGFVGEPFAIGSYRVQAQTGGHSHLSELQAVGDFSLRFNLASEVIGRGLQTSALRISRERNGQPHVANTPLLVSLQSSDASRVHVPATVSIPANQSGVDLPVTGLALASSVQISATVTDTYRAATPLALSVVEPQIVLERLDGSRVVGGQRDEFGVSWLVPGATHPNQASVAGTTVDLAIVEADPISIVPGITDGVAAVSSVLIAQGARSAIAYVEPPTLTGSYKVSAAAATVNGGPWLSAIQQVVDNTLQFNPSQTQTSVGLAAQVDLQLVGQTVGSTTINLDAQPSGVVGTPQSLELSAGNQVQRIKVIGQSVGNAVVTAASIGVGIASTTLGVQVMPLQFEFARGGSDAIYGRFTSPGGVVQDTEVQFEIIDANPAGLVTITENATIRINEGVNSTNYGEYPQYFTRLQFLQSGTYRIRATVAGLGVFESPVYTAEGPPPSGADLDIYNDEYTIGSGLYGASLGFLRVQKDGAPLFPPEPFTLQLACLQPTVCTPQSPLTVTNSTYLAVTGGAVGDSVLRASASGYGSDDALIHVVPPVIEFYFDSFEPFTVGSVRNLSFYIGPGGTPLQDIALTVTSSNSGQVSGIPATSIIEASSYGNGFDLEALSPGTFTVTVSAPGVGSFTSEPITVEAP